MMLARMDIRQRYRRSILGPFWITITMIIFILAIGPLYSRLLGMGSDEFIPYLAMASSPGAWSPACSSTAPAPSSAPRTSCAR
jgi:ABC-type polysaccharide/polyol phosphate export permease